MIWFQIGRKNKEEFYYIISPKLKKADLIYKKNKKNHSPKRVNGWFGIEDRGGQNYVGHPRYLQKGTERFSFYIDKIVETIKKIVPKYDDNNIYNLFIFLYTRW